MNGMSNNEVREDALSTLYGTGSYMRLAGDLGSKPRIDGAIMLSWLVATVRLSPVGGMGRLSGSVFGW